MSYSSNSNNSKSYKVTEQDRTYYRELIWKNALELFEKRNVLPQNAIINSQMRYINSFSLKGSKKSNKYKTIELLNTYFKSSNKLLATQVFYNTVLKKI